MLPLDSKLWSDLFEILTQYFELDQAAAKIDSKFLFDHLLWFRCSMTVVLERNKSVVDIGLAERLLELRGV